MTDFIQVPNGTGNNTIIWYVPAGADPAMYEVSMTDSMNFHIAASDTGKHTIFSYFVGSPSDWAHMMVAEGYYRRLTVGTYQFSLYAGDSTNCEGSLIATTPPTQLVDGDVWHLYAMGDATNGFALMPVKLGRN